MIQELESILDFYTPNIPSFKDEKGMQWFNAGNRHLGELLGYKNAYHVIPNLLEESEYRHVAEKVGRPAIHVNRMGLIKLIIRSPKSEYSKAFIHWLSYKVMSKVVETGTFTISRSDKKLFKAVGIEVGDQL